MQLAYEQFENLIGAAKVVSGPGAGRNALMNLLFRSTPERRDRLADLLQAVDGVSLYAHHDERGTPTGLMIDYHGFHIASITRPPKNGSGRLPWSTKIGPSMSPDLTGRALEIATRITDIQIARLLELHDLIRRLPRPDKNSFLVASFEEKQKTDPNWLEPSAA